MASAIYHLDLGIFGITASQGKRDGISITFLAGSISMTCYESLTVYAVGGDGGDDIASEAISGSCDELLRLCSRQPGKQQ